jgi:hypothetical protein
MSKAKHSRRFSLNTANKQKYSRIKHNHGNGKVAVEAMVAVVVMVAVVEVEICLTDRS